MAETKQGSAQTVVELGGGVGGVAAANRLRRRLDRRHRVVLVDKDAEFALAASFVWVMSGQRQPKQITRPLQSLKRRGIDVVIRNIDSIDAASRTVTVDGSQINGVHLVVSLGADYATDTIPGLQQSGLTFATRSGAEQLGQDIGALSRGRVLIVTAAPLCRCHAAPYEAALLIDAMMRRNGRQRDVDIAIQAAEPAPMVVDGPNVSDAAKTILADRDIDYQPSHQVASAEPNTVIVADGASESFDVLAYMPPIRSPEVVSASASGWIEANRNTLTIAFEGVYAIGDNTQLPLSIGKPLPRAGVFAHAQALMVADNIAATVEGRTPTAAFDGHGGCFIETGFGKAGWGSGDFFAEPSPAVTIRPPSRRWHLGKVAFEFNVKRRWL